MTNRGGGRTPLSYAIRAPLLVDLQHRQKLRRYIAQRSCPVLAMEYGVVPETVRLTENRWARCLTREQQVELRTKRTEYHQAMKEMKRFSLRALAEHYGISVFTVTRVQRTLWGEPY